MVKSVCVVRARPGRDLLDEDYSVEPLLPRLAQARQGGGGAAGDAHRRQIMRREGARSLEAAVPWPAEVEAVACGDHNARAFEWRLERAPVGDGGGRRGPEFLGNGQRHITHGQPLVPAVSAPQTGVFETSLQCNLWTVGAVTTPFRPLYRRRHDRPKPATVIGKEARGTALSRG